MPRISPTSRVVSTTAAFAALALGLTACGGDSTASASGGTDGAARMAFSNGFSGGGPVDEFVAGLSCYADQNGLDAPLVTTADGDVNKQLNDMDSLVARSGKVDGVFVMPVDSAALRPAYDRAKSAGIAVIDSVSPNADGKFATNASAHVAPDDQGVPAMVVEYLVKEHPEVENVVLLSPPPGQVMSDDRAAGFREAAAAAGLTVVTEANMDKITTQEAQKKMEDVLTANRGVQAVFAQNGAMARGAFLAGRSQGVDLVVTSIDSDTDTLAAVRAGDIDATFGVDLFVLAHQASAQAARVNAGETVEFQAIPYQVYTKADAELPSTEQRCAALAN